MDKCSAIRYNKARKRDKGEQPVNMEKKREFLVSFAYWAIIAAGVYLVCEYIVPISVPFFLGLGIAWLAVRVSRKLHWENKGLRIGLAILIYGIFGALLALLIAKGIATVSGIIRWLPDVYEMKLLPFGQLLYNWCLESLEMLDPTVLTVLEKLLDTALSSLKSLLTFVSGAAVNLVSGIATGVPSLFLSLLAMIFSSVFFAADYDRVTSFAKENTPAGVKKVLSQVQYYLKNTLFVVIRSYAAIMLLTFTELSVLFSVIGIQDVMVKAALIALVDIFPIVGTGTVMIPWAIISLVLGYTKLGIQLLVIYVIVTVIRNYVEPKIVGTQLGLHPIITLIAMFIGLRLFGFLGLFGLPVGISFLWKQHLENQKKVAEGS